MTTISTVFVTPAPSCPPADIVIVPRPEEHVRAAIHWFECLRPDQQDEVLEAYRATRFLADDPASYDDHEGEGIEYYGP